MGIFQGKSIDVPARKPQIDSVALIGSKYVNEPHRFKVRSDPIVTNRKGHELSELE